jgi:hypothetical protein
MNRAPSVYIGWRGFVRSVGYRSIAAGPTQPLCQPLTSTQREARYKESSTEQEEQAHQRTASIVNVVHC